MRRRRASIILPLPDAPLPRPGLRPEGAPPAPQEPCWACGSRTFWLSVWGRWACSTCHPPASLVIVAKEVSI
jgi:hypothetical protein